jgi:acetyl esterase/lipase
LRENSLRLPHIAVLLALGIGCKQNGTTDPSAVPALAMANVAYGADAAEVMDVALPAGRSGSTAVVVFIHGGGWSGGDKSIFTAADLKKFTDRGYAVVNINYRLASNAANIHDPLLSNDVTAALDFVATRANEYRVSGARFALVGHSAGAHLALLAGYKYDPARRIKAVASLSGPTDLNDATFLAIPTIRATIEQYLGATQAAQPASWTASSPVSVATTTSSPTIIVHGMVDVLVPYTLAQKLDARLTTLGVPHEYDLFPGYNHDLGYASILRFPDAVWDPVLAWFDRYVK